MVLLRSLHHLHVVTRPEPWKLWAQPYVYSLCEGPQSDGEFTAAVVCLWSTGLYAPMTSAVPRGGGGGWVVPGKRLNLLSHVRHTNVQSHQFVMGVSVHRSCRQCFLLMLVVFSTDSLQHVRLNLTDAHDLNISSWQSTFHRSGFQVNLDPFPFSSAKY